MFQYGYVAAWSVYNSDHLAKKGHDYLPTKSSAWVIPLAQWPMPLACVTPMPLKIYWADVNFPPDEGPVNVQHYVDGYCIFSNSYLGQGDQSVCITSQDFSPCCLLVLLEGKRAGTVAHSQPWIYLQLQQHLAFCSLKQAGRGEAELCNKK